MWVPGTTPDTGQWVNVASTPGASTDAAHIVLVVNVEELIREGFFSSGDMRYFRVVVTNLHGIAVPSAVDADLTTTPDHGDRQGPLRLIPLSNTAFAAAP